MREFLIGPNDAGQRLDRFLAKAMPRMPFPLLQKAVRTRHVKVDGRRAEASARLVAGQTVCVYLREETAAERAPSWQTTPWEDLNIVFEDEHIILLHKPPGLLSQPDDSGMGRSLIEMVQAYLFASGQWSPERENAFAPALAHRIDRNTGGLVLAAKTAEALRILNEKFRAREIDKYYLCLVHGVPQPPRGTLRHYLQRDLQARRVVVREQRQGGAKTALTAYRVLESRGALSLVECRLLTGRTHQIRAQWAAAGHPLLGDGKYGTNSRDRAAGFTHQALYAHRLVMSFPTDAGCLNSLRGREFVLPEVPFVNAFLAGEIASFFEKQ